MSSNAIGSERIAKIIGYNLKAGQFQETSGNLPQRIAVLGEANTLNQGTLDLTPRLITSAIEAGEFYGFGSVLYQQFRILRARSGDTTGGIPTFAYPQAEAGGAASKILTITITGTANASVTHSVEIAGREFLDGGSFSFTVLKGETEDEIGFKIRDAINNVTGAIVTATVVNGVTTFIVTLESKWKGETADGIKVRVITNDNDAGLTYVVATTQSGVGDPSIAAALTSFDDNWNTLVLNPYGISKLDELEAHNGIPDPENPSGRYIGEIFKPYIALFGSVLQDKDAIAAITDPRKDEVTNALCPAPNSFGMPYEAAANMATVWVRIAQDKPRLDASDSFYPDMPGLGSNENIGDMSDYNNRDFLVKKGASTVIFNGRYRVEDFITTYHKEGEEPANFRYVSNLNIDFNFRFRYLSDEAIHVVGKVIAGDNDIIDVPDVIKPKQWKALVGELVDTLVSEALITDAEFTKTSLVVSKAGINPDRLDTTFSYKRRSYGRILSTTAEAGFSFN